MQPFKPNALKAAVVAICPDVELRLRHSVLETDERQLWRELSTCLLSSQVPYDLALAAAEAIDRRGILLDAPSGGPEAIANEIEHIFRSPLDVGGRRRHYRFRVSKSNQLARTWHAVHRQHRSLSSLLANFENEH